MVWEICLPEPLITAENTKISLFGSLWTGQPTYHVMGQPRACVFVHVSVSCLSKCSFNREGVSTGRWRLPKGGALANRLLPLATPKLSQSGSWFPPIEVEFIDQPCGFKSIEFDLGVNCLLLSNLPLRDVRPLPPRSRPDPVSGAELIASCCHPTDLKLL